MSKDVSEFISSCLICKRFSSKPRFRLLHGILSSPFILDLLSLDFVGPRKWNSEIFYYLVAIDHGSRFVRTMVCKSPSSENAIEFLKNCWIPVFGVPSVILVDRGSSFTSSEFRQYVVMTISAHLTYTSPYYPQGNAINEACHQSIERGLKTANVGSAESFKDSLNDVTFVYNCIPSFGNGLSPFFLLFGIEPTFPGWQRLKTTSDDEVRIVSRDEARHRLIIQNELITKNIELLSQKKFEVGQWIVYFLSKYEQRKLRETEDDVSLKYSPSWSLPCRVVQVKDKVLIVHEMGSKELERQVPVSQVKLLKNEIPEPLAKLNLKLLEISAPLHIRHRKVDNNSTTSSSRTMDDIVSESLRNRKRQRPSDVLD